MLFALQQFLTQGFIIVKKAYLYINNGSIFMVLMQKQIIWTCEWHAEHPFAGQNIQQSIFYFVNNTVPQLYAMIMLNAYS